jgi:transposase
MMLLPPDLREWIPAGDIVHFVIEAAALVPLSEFDTNEMGTGEEQYHPHMMLALLLYCYSHGIFGSRRIEKATWKDVSVRYICGGKHHPDHDTICTFRVKNEKAISQAFLRVLKLAREMGVLKVGTVSVDGTKIKANASIHNSLRYDRAGQLEAQLKLEIDGLMAKARDAETNEPRDQEELAGELQRLDTLREKMRKAQETLEKRAKDTQKAKKNDKDDPGDPPPVPKPEPKHQVNLTDSDSRIMRKNNRSGYEQSYNAQAVVDATGSMLVLGGRVSNVGPDSGQLAIDIDSVPTELGTIETVIADTGYASGEPVQELQARGMEVVVALGKQAKMHRRAHDFRPVPKDDPKAKAPIVWRKPWVVEMRRILESERGQQIYKLRKQSVEPVFGIIKQAMGFRQFLLRGLQKTNLEWQLVTCAYNLKRMATLMA